ncbi:MAG: mannose-1-phosphate guanylyltransferase/mannose-6-phosphate isomerase [Gammaproteobacteria bacterium]|nr:mannose-1-phosphate guanylyltransferase/mannose-6-phosphate isomerase [Gammaproteobacteria bacterium]
MIYPVVMAGGTGSRLWPVSRDSLPKQFVELLPGKPTLFQQTLLRLQGLEKLAEPIVLCNEAHRFLAAEQLNDIAIEQAAIILEPVVRNTAPAVALAAMSALEKQKDAVLLILAADHLIEKVDVFHQAISRAVDAAEQGQLVTFGIVPERPETGYGYIRRAAPAGELFQVAEFVEKPDAARAQAYLDSGDYYWNSGMFVFRADSYLRELEAHAVEIFNCCTKAFQDSQAEQLFREIPESRFAESPSDSIDYAVMEKTANALVVPLAADWSDLGAWDAIWDKAEKNADGNVLAGDNLVHQVKNSYIHASSRLVTVAGMEDAVVVETADSVLVTNKASAQDVKTLVELLRGNNRSEVSLPHVVRRPWGSYESLAEGPGFQVKRIIVKPGASLSLQLHHHRAEHWTVVSGKAKVTNGDEVLSLQADQSTYIPVKVKHRLENTGNEDVIVIEVQCGSYLGEDDIERFEDKYGRIK